MPTRPHPLDRLPLSALQVTALLVLALPVAGLALALADTADASVRWPVGARHMGLLWRSVVFSGAVALGTAVLGAWLAWGLMGVRHGSRVLACVLAPLLIMPLSIQGLNWATAILQLNSHWQRSGAAFQLAGWPAAWLAEVLSMLPLATGIAWAGFSLLDRRLLESAILYQGPRAVVWRVALPLAWPMLATGVGLLFVLSLADYTVPSVFVVQVYALEIFSAYSASSHPSGAIITALPVMAVIGAVMALMLLGGVRSRPFRNTGSRGSWPCRTSGWHAATAVGTLGLLLVLPLAALAAGAGSWERLLDAAGAARDEIRVSLRVALTTAAVVVLLGIGVARGMLRGRGRPIWWFLACLMFAIPAPLVGIGLLRIASLGGPWLEQCLPVWACVTRFLPVGGFVGYAVLRRLDHDLLEAARVYQHSRWHGARRVVLPLARSGWVVAAVAGFTLTLGELGASLLVALPGESTLIIRMYNLLHYGASQEVAALGLALALPALAAGLALAVWLVKSD